MTWIDWTIMIVPVVFVMYMGFYSRKYIKEKLSKIFSVMEIPRLNAVTSYTIREFFEASESKRKKQKGFLLLSRKFEC